MSALLTMYHEISYIMVSKIENVLNIFIAENSLFLSFKINFVFYIKELVLGLWTFVEKAMLKYSVASIYGF